MVGKQYIVWTVQAESNDLPVSCNLPVNNLLNCGYAEHLETVKETMIKSRVIARCRYKPRIVVRNKEEGMNNRIMSKKPKNIINKFILYFM